VKLSLPPWLGDDGADAWIQRDGDADQAEQAEEGASPVALQEGGPAGQRIGLDISFLRTRLLSNRYLPCSRAARNPADSQVKLSVKLQGGQHVPGWARIQQLQDETRVYERRSMREDWSV
jgi:hypothetical protein